MTRRVNYLTAVLLFFSLSGYGKDLFEETRYRERFLPSEFFGIQTHVNLPSDIPKLKALGIRELRVDFHFDVFSPQKGVVDLKSSYIIQSADLGVAEGFGLLPCVTHAPKWAMTKEGTWPNDQSIEDFEELMFRLATKYKGKIKYWEAMNEPIVFTAPMNVWRERFVMFLRAFRQGIKRADPENKVVLCGWGGDEPKELEVVYKYGGKDLFDVVGCHPYTRPRMPEEGGFTEQIKGIWDMIRKYGDDKPIWVTEIGWPGVEPTMLEYLRAKYSTHRSGSCTEEDQARGLVRTYLVAATLPVVERVYLFHLNQGTPYSQIVENADHYMGLYGPWFDAFGDISGPCRPKEAFFAVKTCVKMLSGSTFKGRIPLGNRLWALLFEHKDEYFAVVWSLDEGARLVLDDIGSIKAATSMVGTPILIQNNTLEISGRPIYLHIEKNKVAAFKEALRRSKKHRGKAPVAAQPALSPTLLQIPRRSKDFSADGHLNEWSASLSVRLGDKVPDWQMQNWKGLSDCSANVYLAWDEQALSMAVKVRDDIHHPFSGSGQETLWMGDSLQIGIDLEGDAQPTANLSRYDGRNDVEFGLALALEGPAAYAWVNPEGRTGPMVIKDCSIVRNNKEGTTVYEFAVPWSMFGDTKPPAGRTMGINVLINDNDGGGRKGYIEWTPGIGQEKDPSRFSKVMLQSISE